MTDNVIPMLPPGCFFLKDLPQRRSISEHAVSTGWWELDQIWRLYDGQFTVVTGLAGSGKSTMVLNVVANIATQGHKVFLFAPENEQSILEKMRGIWGNRKGWNAFVEGQVIIQSANDEYFAAEEPVDLRSVLDRAEKVMKIHGAGVLVIDPWNELEHLKPPDQMMTDYIRTALMYLKKICRRYGIAVILIAHPTKAVTEKGGRTPTLADIEGSMSWYNKCDNGLIVVREATETMVISAKVRENGAGKLGVCHFHVDPQTGLFTPMHGAVTP